MTEWSKEANEYLDAYLRQVGVLVREQGDDPEEVVSALRDHVRNDVEPARGEAIAVEDVSDVLRSLGTPDQVTNADRISLADKSRGSQVVFLNTGRRRSCGFYAAILVAAFLAVIGLAVGMALLSYDSDLDNQSEQSEWGPVVP